jgi:hypothetical protein
MLMSLLLSICSRSIEDQDRDLYPDFFQLTVESSIANIILAWIRNIQHGRDRDSNLRAATTYTLMSAQPAAQERWPPNYGRSTTICPILVGSWKAEHQALLKPSNATCDLATRWHRWRLETKVSICMAQKTAVCDRELAQKRPLANERD